MQMHGRPETRLLSPYGGQSGGQEEGAGGRQEEGRFGGRSRQIWQEEAESGVGRRQLGTRTTTGDVGREAFWGEGRRWQCHASLSGDGWRHRRRAASRIVVGWRWSHASSSIGVEGETLTPPPPFEPGGGLRVRMGMGGTWYGVRNFG